MKHSWKYGMLWGVLLLGLPYLASQQAASEAVIYDSPAAVRPLPPGARAPGGTLQTATGADFDLAAAVAGQPTVLVFYRGSW